MRDTLSTELLANLPLVHILPETGSGHTTSINTFSQRYRRPKLARTTNCELQRTDMRWVKRTDAFNIAIHESVYRSARDIGSEQTDGGRTTISQKALSLILSRVQQSNTRFYWIWWNVDTRANCSRFRLGAFHKSSRNWELCTLGCTSDYYVASQPHVARACYRYGN